MNRCERRDLPAPLLFIELVWADVNALKHSQMSSHIHAWHIISHNVLFHPMCSIQCAVPSDVPFHPMNCYDQHINVANPTRPTFQTRYRTDISEDHPSCKPCHIWAQHRVLCRHMIVALQKHNPSMLLAAKRQQVHHTHHRPTHHCILCAAAKHLRCR